MRDLLSNIAARLDRTIDHWPAIAASVTVSAVAAAFIAINWQGIR
jgi:hypothetical protein